MENIRIGAVFSLANAENDSSAPEPIKAEIAHDVTPEVPNQHDSNETPPSLEDPDAPPTLPLMENIMPLECIQEEGTEFIAPPTLTREPGTEMKKKRLRKNLTLKKFAKRRKEPGTSSYVTTEPETNEANTSMKRIFPSYLVLTSIQKVLGDSYKISYRALRAMKIKECTNMCKKMHFIRRLKNGKDVFNVKLGEVYETEVNEDKAEPSSNRKRGKEKCTRVAREPIKRVRKERNTNADQLRIIRVMVANVRAKKKREKVARIKREKKKEKQPKRDRAKEVRDKKPAAEETPQETEKPSISERSGRKIKPNPFFTGYIRNKDEMCKAIKEVKDSERLQRLQKIAKKKEELSSNKEEFQLEVDNPEKSSIRTISNGQDKTKPLSGGIKQKGKKLKKFPVFARMPKDFKRIKNGKPLLHARTKLKLGIAATNKRRREKSEKMTSLKNRDFEILKDAMENDDACVLNSLLTSSETEKNGSPVKKIFTQSVTVGKEHEGFPVARSLLTGNLNPAVIPVKGSNPGSTVATNMTTKSNPPGHPVVTLVPQGSLKPSTSENSVLQPVILNHNGLLYLTYKSPSPTSQNTSFTSISKPALATAEHPAAGKILLHDKGKPGLNVATTAATALPSVKTTNQSGPSVRPQLIVSSMPNVQNQNTGGTVGPQSAAYTTQPASVILPPSASPPVLIKPTVSTAVSRGGTAANAMAPSLIRPGVIAKPIIQPTTRPSTLPTALSPGKYRLLAARNATSAVPGQKIVHAVSSLLKGESKTSPLRATGISAGKQDIQSLITKIKVEPKSPESETSEKCLEKSPGTTATSSLTSTTTTTDKTKFYLMRVEGKNILIPMKGNSIQPRAYLVNGDIGGQVKMTSTATSPASYAPNFVPNRTSSAQIGGTANVTSLTGQSKTLSDKSAMLKGTELSGTSKDSVDNRQLLNWSKRQDPGLINVPVIDKKKQDEKPETREEKKGAFSEAVTDREDKLRKLKELLKEKQKAVEELRQSRQQNSKSVDETA